MRETVPSSINSIGPTSRRFSLFSLSISYLIAREIIIIIIMLSESKRPNCWILKRKEDYFDVLTRLIAYYIPAKQQLHAFCKLEWAKSAIFCTRMTNFTEVLSYEFVTLLLGWLFLLLHAFATCPVGRRSWVGRICHVESAARCMQILSSAILKNFLLNFPQTRELSFRNGLLKMLMDSTRFIKFLRNFLWDMCKLLNYPYTEHRIVIVS